MKRGKARSSRAMLRTRRRPPGRSPPPPAGNAADDGSAGPLRALTSDMWYTLVYLRPADQNALTRRREGVWIDRLRPGGYSRAESRALVDRLNEWGEAREAEGKCPSIRDQARWLSAVSRVELSGDEIADTLDRQIAAAGVRLAPGVRPTLDRLRDGGIRLGLVSNLLHETGAGARELLASLGILGEFASCVFSDEHPWSKPGPEPFRYALGELGVPVGEGAHIGDLAYDVQGAVRAGMHAFLYTGLHRLEPPRLRALALAAESAATARVGRWSQLPARMLDGH
jgi:HAD superfamily hydrolase (TIGR01509 family)